MAYNLQSLITILRKILIHPQNTHPFVTTHQNQLGSLLQKSVELKELLKNSTGPELEILGSQIRDAAHEAEDIIECHMLNQVDLLRTRTGTGLSWPALDLQQVMTEFDSAIEQAVAIVEEKMMVLTGSSSSGAAASLPKTKMLTGRSSSVLPDHPNSKRVVVGVDEALLKLTDWLTGHGRELRIIPLFGMGGIGKTTLAHELYEHNFVAWRFDVRAWTTISQDYNVREVLLGLLRRPNEKLSNELTECTDDKLIQILYQKLYHRRYLVVLDDMWHSKSWDAIRSCFPDNNNGSRIILTTRHSDLARYVGTHNLQHEVQLMNETQSWNLLNNIVFGEEKLGASALHETGRKIANDCGGLPLAINVMGGILSKAERSIDDWDHIAKDVRAAIVEKGKGKLSNVLDLSYNHLPNHLRPFFLYMGAFQEDCEIKGSRLISLLVAEGFSESHGDKSLEEVAGDYFGALVERNLVTVTRERSNGKALCYGMHDLLRDLCRRKGGEEKFLHVIKNERSLEVGMALKRVRRASVDHASYSDVRAMSLARSLIICPGGDIRVAQLALSFMAPAMIVSPVYSLWRLLRVLDVFDLLTTVFPVELLQLVNLRYLAFSCRSKSDIPREISKLVNLQTLIAKINWGDVPDEIWEMSELRHLKLDSGIYLRKGIKPNMNEKLQTISWMLCSPQVKWTDLFESIPNVRKLSVIIAKWNEEVDLGHLQKLGTLRCQSDPNEVIWRYLPALRFPPTLRKLTLFKCLTFPGDWRTLCALLNLEVLKICESVFVEEVIELEATEGDPYVFQSLQVLVLQNLNNLVRWTADHTNFPTLRRLGIINCPVLEEIPSGIGDIWTLQYIEMAGCGRSVEASAKQIKEELSENGIYDLKLDIFY